MWKFTPILALVLTVSDLGKCQLPENEFSSTSSCYGISHMDKWMDASCVNNHVIAVKDFIVATKPSETNCTETEVEDNFDECCLGVTDNEDCPYVHQEDATLRMSGECRGRQNCQNQPTRVRTSDDCDLTSHADYTNYIQMNYYCIDESKMITHCYGYASSTDPGSIIYVQSPGFPAEIPNNTDCSCSIETDNCGSGIDVYTLQRILMDSGSTCEQQLHIQLSDGSKGMWTCDNNTAGIEVVSVPVSYFTISLNNNLDDNKGNFWIGFKSSNDQGNMYIKCPGEPQLYCTSTSDSQSSASPLDGKTIAIIVLAVILGLVTVALVAVVLCRKVSCSKEQDEEKVVKPLQSKVVGSTTDMKLTTASEENKENETKPKLAKQPMTSPTQQRTNKAQKKSDSVNIRQNKHARKSKRAKQIAHTDTIPKATNQKSSNEATTFHPSTDPQGKLIQLLTDQYSPNSSSHTLNAKKKINKSQVVPSTQLCKSPRQMSPHKHDTGAKRQRLFQAVLSANKESLNTTPRNRSPNGSIHFKGSRIASPSPRRRPQSAPVTRYGRNKRCYQKTSIQNPETLSLTREWTHPDQVTYAVHVASIDLRRKNNKRKRAYKTIETNKAILTDGVNKTDMMPILSKWETTSGERKLEYTYDRNTDEIETRFKTAESKRNSRPRSTSRKSRPNSTTEDQGSRNDERKLSKLLKLVTEAFIEQDRENEQKKEHTSADNICLTNRTSSDMPTSRHRKRKKLR